jgi:uncharacterized membrane protein
MKRITSAAMARIARIFITGLLAALPLVATAAVVWWAGSIIVRWLGPQSAVGSLLVALGLGVTGSEVVGYLIGLALVAAVIFVLGLVVSQGLQRGVARLFGEVLQRIPLVGSIYDLARRLVGLFAQRKDGGMNSMSAVWCHFGGAPDARDAEPHAAQGTVVLALLSTPEPVRIDGRDYLGVIVPTAPVPIGGALLYVPVNWVRPAALGIEAVTSVYVSMGITSAEQFAAAAAARAPQPGAA